MMGGGAAVGMKWMEHKVVQHARAWASGGIPGQAGKDECVVCGKHIRKHRKVTGEGRVCSVACAHFWVENMS
ncbi:hypothetical protein KUTG_04107 [Kutzneria sp. 744]|nr:hypothetical protein KUTG_04107 [Kutzneria sp. 744]